MLTARQPRTMKLVSLLLAVLAFVHGINAEAVAKTPAAADLTPQQELNDKIDWVRPLLKLRL